MVNLNLPYTEVIHLKTLMDEYNIVEKRRSISSYILRKFYSMNIKSFVKHLRKKIDSDVTIIKKDIMDFGRFLICIDANSNNKDNICVVKSSESGLRYILEFKKGDDILVIDGVKNDSPVMEISISGSSTDTSEYIHGYWGDFIHKCMIDIICEYITQ